MRHHSASTSAQHTSARCVALRTTRAWCQWAASCLPHQSLRLQRAIPRTQQAMLFTSLRSNRRDCTVRQACRHVLLVFCPRIPHRIHCAMHLITYDPTAPASDASDSGDDSSSVPLTSQHSSASLPSLADDQPPPGYVRHCCRAPRRTIVAQGAVEGKRQEEEKASGRQSRRPLCAARPAKRTLPGH